MGALTGDACPPCTALARTARVPPCVYALTVPRRLGFPSTYVFHDVYGFDPDLLAMARARHSRLRRVVGANNRAWAPAQVPSPVRAVLLLFPINAASEHAKAEQEARIAKEGQQARAALRLAKAGHRAARRLARLAHAAAARRR